MNKKLLLGVGLIAIAGYLIWKGKQKKSFTGPVWYKDPEISGVPITIINK